MMLPRACCLLMLIRHTPRARRAIITPRRSASAIYMRARAARAIRYAEPRVAATRHAYAITLHALRHAAAPAQSAVTPARWRAMLLMLRGLMICYAIDFAAMPLR